GSRHSIVPHLEYDLTDKDIHKDLFKIIKYLCEEVCSTKKQVNQVLKLWTTFLEPMLYVPSRPENSNNVEDVEISTRGATRNEACNGDDNVSPKRVDSSKVIMVNGGILPKEDGSKVEKDVKNTCIRDKAPAVGVVNDNVLPRSSRELSGRDATPRLRNIHDDGHEAKSNIDDVPLSQQGDTSRTPPVANGNFTKFEKEEEELSPNVYFDEADLAVYGDHNGSNAKAKHSMEIDADADDEDSKNIPQGGDDVSGCGSTADECSREDHEDGDYDDLDGKAKSEVEAEGIDDANFIVMMPTNCSMECLNEIGLLLVSTYYEVAPQMLYFVAYRKLGVLHVDSLDLDGENRERMRLGLFQFSLRDQASNWLECLPARSITTWEDLTTRFLAQFFPPGRTEKLRNDILMFQQHHGESLSEAWTRFKDLLMA
nr:paired amphipathic helix protein Sin3-like 2 isoform X3 [Tanacetum cinerariifolium]